MPTPDPEPQQPIANSPNPEINAHPSSDNGPNTLTDESLVDLQKYNQSNFDRGKPSWLILLWWLVQDLAFLLTPHPFNGIRSRLLRLFGAKIGPGVIIRPIVPNWKCHAAVLKAKFDFKLNIIICQLPTRNRNSRSQIPQILK